MRAALIFVLSFLLVAAPALAGDGVDEDSPAARVYRDAWWTETGAGELEKALELYETALGLEGTDAVKARALFRMGVVQERVGRTEEALRTFARLSAEYPDQKELLAEAERLLEAWTAEDLEQGFDDWYARYQYSPEFQAKVVDLVLRLGTQAAKGNTTPVEEKELLTIGEASKPALRRHLESSNENLRAWVVALLLQLGEVPPASALLETDVWLDRKGAWTTLLTLSASDAQRFAAALPQDGERADVLRAVVQGPEAALAFYDETAQGSFFDREVGRDLLYALLDRPGGVPSVEAFERFVRDTTEEWRDQRWASFVVRKLGDAGQLSDDFVLHLLRRGPTWARSDVLRRVVSGDFVHPEAWRAIAEAMLAKDFNTKASPNLQFLDALLRAVAAAETDDLGLASRAFETWARESGGRVAYNPSFARPLARAGIRRLTPAVVENSRDLEAVRGAMSLEAQVGQVPGGGFESESLMRLLAWAETAPLAEARAFAASHVGHAVGQFGAAPDPVLEALPRLAPDAAVNVLYGLVRASERIDWTSARLDTLLEVMRDQDGRGTGEASKILSGTVFETADGVNRVFDVVAAHPTERWAAALGAVQEAQVSEAVCAHARAGLRDRWEAWSAAERVAMLEAVPRLLRPCETDPAFEAWVRARLPELAVDDRARLLALLDDPTLDDFRAAYDLTDPAQAMQASHWGRLPYTREVYDALEAARRHPDVSERQRFCDRWLDARRDAELRHQIARDLLEDASADVRERGVRILADRKDPADVGLLAKALGDDSAKVRRLAAAALQSVYDKDALVALAAALDDPDPAVREQVLATLEAIKKNEELKAYWREFAEER